MTRSQPNFISPTANTLASSVYPRHQSHECSLHPERLSITSDLTGDESLVRGDLTPTTILPSSSPSSNSTKVTTSATISSIGLRLTSKQAQV